MSEEPCPLSEREIEIVRLVATGASNQQIARDLYISVNTVKVHLRNIFAKLELNSRTEVAMYAVRQGWVLVPATETSQGPAEDKEVEEEEEEEAELVEPAAEEAVAQPAPRPPTGRRWWPFLAVGGAAVLLVLILLAIPIAGALITSPATPTSPPQPTTTPIGTMLAVPPRWQERAPLPLARTGLAVAVHEGRLYAIGGETKAGAIGSVTRYDPQSDTWTERAAKPTPVTDVDAALLGGRLFVPGGRTAAGQVTNRMEVYDPEADAWTVAASLPISVSAYALTAFEGQLYLFGGWDGSRFVTTTYAYDPGRDTWTARAPMPTARGHAGAAVADGKIFVVGGTDGNQDLAANEEYVPSKDNGNGKGSPWTARAPLPAGRSGVGVTAVANMIYVIGGGPGERSAPLKYNVRDDRWEEFEAPTTGVWRNLGVDVVDAKIYAVGGWDGSQPLASNREYQALYVIIIPLVATTPVP
jgi:DNA-binding CsgD family transcriptional regulator/N-acetylneuraminic acid mutarotase